MIFTLKTGYSDHFVKLKYRPQDTLNANVVDYAVGSRGQFPVRL